ncbi:unnamed protein product [Heterobilharzia americana]|nr:unnamed protein product [Heterobilharzia americana]
MPYTPVCHYYQAGCCRKGDECTFVHPKVRCRTYAADGWCPYGYNCHFWHDPSVKSNVSLTKKPCQFFANNQCKYGDKCSFSHDIDSEQNNGVTLEEYRAAKKLVELCISNQSSASANTETSAWTLVECSSEPNIARISSTLLSESSNKNMTSAPIYVNNQNIVSCVKQHYGKPTSVRILKYQGVSKDEVVKLSHLEIERLKKYYPPEKLREIESTKDYQTFCIRFSATDPGWVYDVREVLLNITIPHLYPKKPLQITAIMQDNLPTVLVEYLNKSIASWIRYKHQYFERMQRIELYLRPFFLWFDRNLEELFTEGLRKYKAILENGNFSSISSLVSIGNGVDDICKSQQVEDEVSREISCLDSDKLIGLIPPVMHSKLPVNDEQSSQNLTTDNVLQVRNDTDLLQSTKRILEKTGDRLSTQLKSSGLRTGKNTHHIYSSQRKTASYLSNLSPENDNLMDFIHLVVPEGKSSNEPQESNCSSDTQSYSSDENDNSVNESEVNLETREPLLKSTGSNSDDEANVPKSSVDDEKKKLGVSSSEACTLNSPGTQKLLMSDFRLFGKAGTFIQRRLSVSLHCTRCRLPFQWIFTFHGAQRMDIFNNHNMTDRFLRSLPPYTANCARCQHSFSLLFQSSLAHGFEKIVGTLHLEGCIADDIPPKQSDGIIWCTGCFSSVRINELDFERPHTRRCFKCHSLIGLEFTKFHLELIKQPSNVTISKTDNCRNKQEASSEVSRRLQRTLNSAQNALIQDGSPLPAFGSCKHYRKSYRWLRFPCCGRLEPCDVCHDNSAVDGHEMEMATRMICGFCSKEQPFSAVKPCVRCGKMLSGTRSSHWEGGKGCRNRVIMSRKDSKKYSQVNKVISKKKTSKNK